MRPDDADMRGQDRDARLAGQTGPVGKGMRPDDAALPNGVVLLDGATRPGGAPAARPTPSPRSEPRTSG